jgi:hypothetical protein
MAQLIGALSRCNRRDEAPDRRFPVAHDLAVAGPRSVGGRIDGQIASGILEQIILVQVSSEQGVARQGGEHWCSTAEPDGDLRCSIS